ncbi:flagellin [Deltaproteobacteria bacterium TL4]
MSFRINHNISSMNTQRMLNNTTRAQSSSLERLSSGQKINKGSDSPAALVISERLRSQVSGLTQAIDNSETDISLVQTAEGALNEVSRMLINARQLSVHAANEGVNDDVMLAADQSEITNALDTVDRIAKFTQFGKKNLIDGSRGASGVANGENLEFVSASTKTKTSGVSGYGVNITQAATRSELNGTVGLTQEIIDSGERITILEGGKTLHFATKKGESVESTLNALAVKIGEVGLDVELLRDDTGFKAPAVDSAQISSTQDANANVEGVESDIPPAAMKGLIRLRHKKYGSEFSISASSSTAGILSKQSNVTVEAKRGLDVAGKINGEEAEGRGQTLTGKLGTKNTEGLSIRFTGEVAPPPNTTIGAVAVFNNSLKFQIGANAGQTTEFSMKNMSSRALGTGIETESGFKMLRDIDVTTAQGAQDSIRILDEALVQVASTRGDLGAFQKNNLVSNLNSLRNTHENLTNAESVIRDADMAQEMADFTKNQIMMQSGTAMLAQANQVPQAALSLLNR